jgi:hypothetical protein
MFVFSFNFQCVVWACRFAPSLLSGQLTNRLIPIIENNLALVSSVALIKIVISHALINKICCLRLNHFDAVLMGVFLNTLIYTR